MSNIKIFVSRRIDVNSTRIDNPLYVPVRCGAVYDDKPSDMLGDDTGDNISERRNSFCEFTVEYWAWKNTKSDYVGLCHYRRYLTFSTRKFKENNMRQVMEGYLNGPSIKKYELDNVKLMESVIEGSDTVVNFAADVAGVPTPKGFQKSVRAHWEGYDGVYFDKRVFPMLLDDIKVYSADIYSCAVEYLAGRYHRGYDCYVMRRDIFDKMCDFQFSVMFRLEREIHEKGYDIDCPRTMGYMGEILYGIFIHYLQHRTDCRIKEVQLVYFEQTEMPDSRWKYFLEKILFWVKFNFEDIGYALLPKASKRRNFVKKIYFRLTKRKN